MTWLQQQLQIFGTLGTTISNYQIPFVTHETVAPVEIVYTKPWVHFSACPPHPKLEQEDWLSGL